MLLGAGGAALSICQKARDVGAKVTVLCRSPKKAVAFAEKDGVKVRELSPTVQKECAKVADIVINATPLGMDGIPDDFEDFSFLDETEAAVYDIVYKPAETSLMRESRNRGLRAFNGLGIDVYKRQVEPMAKAAAAVGADGLIVEVHKNPAKALCDGKQSITPEAFDKLVKDLRPLVELSGKTL